MGVAALPAISAGLLGGGLDPRTPVAVVENGWSERQRVTSGTISDIARRATEAGVRSPAVIVIGDVAQLAW
jgi:siroheme synthase